MIELPDRQAFDETPGGTTIGRRVDAAVGSHHQLICIRGMHPERVDVTVIARTEHTAGAEHAPRSSTVVAHRRLKAWLVHAVDDLRIRDDQRKIERTLADHAGAVHLGPALATVSGAEE